MVVNDTLEGLEKLHQKLILFKDSPLYRYRVENNYIPVFGQGSENASIVFIGEAPGKKEAERGIPFCGQSGQILDEALQSINVKRENVYITNIVKDRPQDNRDPTKAEIELYGPFLDKELQLLKPKIIVSLGRFSMEYCMRLFKIEDHLDSISNIHGKKFKIKTPLLNTTLIPFFHPAATIYNRKLKDSFFEDFKLLTM